MRGEAVQRIKEVRALRARQFAEDGGPIAHPVRPSSYMKIDNFYTATIYEKGAELIRMLKIIIGDDAFRRGCDLYFQRWDGQATTVEAFIACFAEASGRDLDGLFRAGTNRPAPPPCRSTPCGTRPPARSTSPCASPPRRRLASRTRRPCRSRSPFGVLDEDGRQMRDTEVVVLDQAEQRIRLEGIDRLPVLSALRGFSAPVVLTTDAPVHDAYVLLASDTDLFNRWEAGQGLARDLILARAGGRPDEVGEERFAEAMGRALDDQSASHAFKALLLSLPSEPDLAQARAPADPGAIHEARDALRLRLAVHLAERLRGLHGALQEAGEFSSLGGGGRAPRPAQRGDRPAGRRSQRPQRRAGAGSLRRRRQHDRRDRRPERLMQIGGEMAQTALDDFHGAGWKAEPLVIDKWFAIQARDPSDGALGRVLGLTAHPDYDARNPNRMRSLVGAFAAGNPARFHDPSGAGYRFLADQILMIDRFNPVAAARMIDPLAGWARYTPDLSALMRAAARPDRGEPRACRRTSSNWRTRPALERPIRPGPVRSRPGRRL